MHKIIAGALFGLAGWAALASMSHGQGLRPEIFTSYDGIPYTQRYSYDMGTPYLHLNMYAKYKGDLLYMDYLDKLDRAHKFGYKIPQDPYVSGEADRVSRRPGRFCLGFGFFGWR